jgi:hypothetical protein
MSKTITLRVDESTYELIQKAAAGERRTISNFIEYATVAYLSEETFVSDGEMEELLQDKDLIADLKRGRADIGKRKYTTVE